MGFSGTVSPTAVITVICCLLVVNAVFYIFFMHIVYHVLMRCVPVLRSVCVVVEVRRRSYLWPFKLSLCCPATYSNMGFRLRRPPRLVERFLLRGA